MILWLVLACLPGIKEVALQLKNRVGVDYCDVLTFSWYCSIIKNKQKSGNLLQVVTGLLLTTESICFPDIPQDLLCSDFQLLSSFIAPYP